MGGASGFAEVSGQGRRLLDLLASRRPLRVSSQHHMSTGNISGVKPEVPGLSDSKGELLIGSTGTPHQNQSTAGAAEAPQCRRSRTTAFRFLRFSDRRQDPQLRDFFAKRLEVLAFGSILELHAQELQILDFL